ncbi:MFS transporter [Brucella cytisi]|nr:MFS transporter [Brucella cytisi]
MAHDGLHGVDRILATVAVMLNVAVANLDIAIANTALPQIARSLQLSAGQAIWITASYQLAMVFALLPAIVCAERIGARKIAIAGIVLFSLASLLCGFSSSLFPLVTGRVLQGIGGACIAGTGIALTRSIFPEKLLGFGMGINAFVVGLSLSAGPTVTSLILGVGSWPWLFLINIPVGAIGIVLGLYAMPPSIPVARRTVKPIILALGAAMTTACCLSLHFSAHGEAAYSAIFAAAAILVLLSLANQPRSVLITALPIDLFARPVFALSALTAVLSFLAMASAFVSLPFLFQWRFGFTQFEAGFLLSVWPVFATLISLLAGPVSDRVSPAILCSTGLMAIATGLCLLSFLPSDSTIEEICAGLALCGTGFGLFQAPNMKAFLLASPADRSSSAGGISTLVGIVGQSLGAALVAAMFNLYGEPGSISALHAGALAALLASIVSLVRNCISQEKPV